ncbi:MAG TPA: hypothetical protein VFH84_15590, partial [Amycolatopsis sp.]|nr:hypothetical protein [Amycolatopsis sp.]
DVFTREVTTIATGLAEPQGLLLHDGELLVVESAGNRIAPVPAAEPTIVTGDAHAVRRPPTVLAPGEIDFSVVFTAPPGEKLDDRFGPSTRLEISASPPSLLADGGGTGTDLNRKIRLAPGVTEGVLQIVAQAASCDDGGEHPACRITRQDWGVPIRIEDGGTSELSLVMAGEPRTGG